MKKILVFGLGSMGYGIAQTLHRSGYKVYGQDKNPVQQKRFVEGGGFDDPFSRLTSSNYSCSK